MNKQCSELNKFWNEIKNKSVITFGDIDKLQDLLNKIYLRVDDLEKSRDNWKEKYEEIKNNYN